MITNLCILCILCGLCDMFFYIFKCVCNVSICNLDIKLGFRLGKSPLCTLFRGNFPGGKIWFVEVD